MEGGDGPGGGSGREKMEINVLEQELKKKKKKLWKPHIILPSFGPGSRQRINVSGDKCGSKILLPYQRDREYFGTYDPELINAEICYYCRGQKASSQWSQAKV